MFRRLRSLSASLLTGVFFLSLLLHGPPCWLANAIKWDSGLTSLPRLTLRLDPGSINGSDVSSVGKWRRLKLFPRKKSSILKEKRKEGNMPILYSVVARGTTVLAKFASCAGNFAEVTEQILSRIPPENSKLTYTQGSYLFHYISEDRIVYLCITDDDFERSKAFMYLTEIKKRFQSAYHGRAQTALPYAMNSEFSRVLSAEMKRFSDTGNQSDNLSKVQGELDELKGIMVKNIDTIAQRGERLELLIDKAEDLNTTSLTFKKSSKGLARAMWWKNVKITIILVIVILLVLYFIVSAACSGLDWSGCIHKDENN